MSEYEVDERVYGKRGKEGVYIPMLEKLQELIMLRDEKKNKLKTNKKHKGLNIVMDSEDDDELDQSDE